MSGSDVLRYIIAFLAVVALALGIASLAHPSLIKSKSTKASAGFFQSCDVNGKCESVFKRSAITFPCQHRESATDGRLATWVLFTIIALILVIVGIVFCLVVKGRSAWSARFIIFIIAAILLALMVGLTWWYWFRYSSCGAKREKSGFKVGPAWILLLVACILAFICAILCLVGMSCKESSGTHIVVNKNEREL